MPQRSPEKDVSVIFDQSDIHVDPDQESDAHVLRQEIAMISPAAKDQNEPKTALSQNLIGRSMIKNNLK